MGKGISKPKPISGNRVASAIDIQVNDSSVLNNTGDEIINVEDARNTRHKGTKSISMFLFNRRKPTSSVRKTVSEVTYHSKPNTTPEFAQLQDELKTLKIDYRDLQRRQEEENVEKNKLKNEVKVLNVSLQRLKSENKKLKEDMRDANERSRTIEQERDHIRRQFTIFRETKEKEMQELRNEKQMLINKLHKLNPDEIPHDNEIMFQRKTSNITHWLLDDTSLPPASYTGKHAGSVVSVNTIAIDVKTNKDIAMALKDLLTSLQHNCIGVPLTNEFYVYVTSTEDMQEAAFAFTQSCKSLIDVFEMERKHICCSYYPLQGNETGERKAPSQAAFLQSASVIVVFCNNGFSIDAQNLINNAISCGQICMVINKTFDETDPFVVSTLMTNTKVRLLTGFTDASECVDTCKNDITEICNMFISKQRETLNCDYGLMRNLCEKSSMCTSFDICYGNTQKSLQKSILQSVVVNDTITEKIDVLNNYITQDTPQQPLLVIGPPGCGKSSLLAAWSIQLKESLENSCILYHVVSSLCPNSTDPVKIMRRFIWLLLDQLPMSCEATQLDKEFPLRLERACTQFTNGVIIIIDGGEMIDGNNEYFQWLYDPLPVPVRVIVSVTEDNSSVTDTITRTGSYPKQWNNWPKLKCLPTQPANNLHALTTLLDATKQSEMDMICTKLPPEKAELITSFEKFLSTYLHYDVVLLILNHLTPMEKLKRTFMKCLQCTEAVQLYSLLIKLILKKYEDALAMEVLVFLSLSYTGLTIMELHELIERDVTDIYEVLHDLQMCKCVCNIGGMMQLATPEVKKAVEKLKNSSSYDQDTICRQHLIDVFNIKFQNNIITKRVLEELPWQLCRLEKFDSLLALLSNSFVFLGLFRMCELTLIAYYWDALQYNVKAMHTLYMNQVNNNTEFYDTLGQYVEDKKLYDLAQVCYKQSLELKEMEYESNDVEILKCHLNLARLFTHWKKYQIAEDHFKFVVTKCESDKVFYAKSLESLAIFYSIQGRYQEVELYQKQAYTIRQEVMSEQTKTSFEQTVSECRQLIDMLVQQLCRHDEIANYYISLGLICFNLKLYSESCECINEALNYLRSAYGDEHPDVADTLCKASYVYQITKDLEKSELFLEQAFAIYMKSCSIDSKEVQTTLKRLVAILTKQKKMGKIEELYTKVIKLEESRLGADHILVAQCVSALAVHLSKQQRFDDALKLYKHTLTIYINQVGFQHDVVSEVLKNMSKVYYEQKRDKEAAQCYMLSLDQDRKIEQLPT